MYLGTDCLADLKTLLIAATVILTAGIAPPLSRQATAQETTPSQTNGDQAAGEEEFNDEILVTARRREENVQEIPISITTLSENDLEASTLVTLNDLDNFTPNLTFSVTGGFGDEASESSVFMRGVGQLVAQRFTTDSGVGIYLDGVFIARSQGAVFDLLDLERVEILRGPQGTLFGRNAIGGAISLVTKKPNEEFGASFSATVGEFSRADVKASVTGLLTDGLAASLTLASANRDGFSRSLFTGQKFGDVNYDAGRLSLAWQPSASVSVHLASDYTRKREAGGNMLLLGIEQVPLVDFFNRVMTAAGRPTYSEEWITPNLRDSNSGFDSFVDGDIYGTSISTTWTGPKIGLQSITSYRGFEIASAGDGDGSPPLFAERERVQRQDQFSQEFQFSGLAGNDKLNWQAGVLYFRERPREVSRGIIFRDLLEVLESLPGPIIAPPDIPPFLCDPGPPPPGLPCFGGAGNPFNQGFAPALGFTVFDMTTESTAVFGEATYALSDKAEITVGLRYSRDDKDLSRFGVESPLGGEPSNLRQDEDSWDAWTPRVSFAYQLRPETLLYATASRGFKSGGFDTTVIESREGFQSYEPEFMWTYEAGFKTDLLDRKLRINQSIFFSDYENIQFIIAEALDAIPVAVIQNAGTAEIFGFELELDAYLTPGLVLNAGIGYIDAELVEINPASGVAEDAVFPNTPDWNYNLGLQYAFSIGEGSMIARADYGWRDDYFYDFFNSPAAAQEAYGLLNARLLYAPSERWEVALFGTNLSDEEYLESALLLGIVGTTLGVGGRPREWGLTCQVRW